jgi:hypothetical protein
VRKYGLFKKVRIYRTKRMKEEITVNKECYFILARVKGNGGN